MKDLTTGAAAVKSPNEAQTTTVSTTPALTLPHLFQPSDHVNVNEPTYLALSVPRSQTLSCV